MNVALGAGPLAGSTHSRGRNACRTPCTRWCGVRIMSQMEPDPFVDADLLETRRRQRQHLASIPDWVLEPRVPKDLATAKAPRWAGRVERTLREVADQELETLDEF